MSDLDRQAIRAMRRSYGEIGLVDLPEDPLAAFASWLKEAAENSFIVEPNAMVLSTLGDNEHISTRTVLLKDISEGGFTFFTNYSSRKAQAIELNSQVTLLFPWFAMERQVSISGFAEKISESESADYFASRPWSSQIGAWASAQSAPLGQKVHRYQSLHIGAAIACCQSALNFGRDAIRGCTIACAMRGLTAKLSGRSLATTRSLNP